MVFAQAVAQGHDGAGQVLQGLILAAKRVLRAR
jgi:hypothetical protein